MPRRTLPIKKFTGVSLDTSAYEELKTKIENLTRPLRIPTSARNRLVTELTDAVCFARVGLAELLAGKNTRPAAWTADILVKDVCSALQAADVPFAMSPERETSRAQWLAGELAKLAGLPEPGQLFSQMQRAREIEKDGGATSPCKPVVPGEWKGLD